jgi:hypothetical protein
MLIDAPHATLEDRKRTLGRVCRRVAPDVLALGMRDHLVRGELPANTRIEPGVVPHERAIGRGMLHHDFEDRRGWSRLKILET